MSTNYNMSTIDSPHHIAMNNFVPVLWPSRTLKNETSELNCDEVEMPQSQLTQMYVYQIRIDGSLKPQLHIHDLSYGRAKIHPDSYPGLSNRNLLA